MARYRSREAETEDVNQRRLQRGAVERRHLTRWSVGHDELAPGVVDHTHLDPSVVEIIREVGGGSGVGQLLVLTATDVDIDDEGYVTFDTITHQNGFAGVTAAGDTITWPTSAVGGAIVMFAWATFTGGGTIELEVDGSVPAWGTIATGSAGTEGRGEIGVDIAAGAVVKLKVTHGEVTAQTATVTMYLKVEDPAYSTPVPGTLIDTMWVDSRLHSMHASHLTYAESNVVLASGVTYLVTVEGNWTPHAENPLPYGESGVPIMFLSPGQSQRDAAIDADTVFASASAGTYPGHEDNLKMNTGSGWGHVEPVGAPYADRQPGHLYTYTVIGEGAKLLASQSDDPLTDNNGMLKIEIYQ